jgi:hypothetical protein
VEWEDSTNWRTTAWVSRMRAMRRCCGTCQAGVNPRLTYYTRQNKIFLRLNLLYHSWQKRHFVLLPRIMKWLTWNSNVYIETVYEIWKTAKKIILPECSLSLEPLTITSSRANYGWIQWCHTINCSCPPLGIAEMSRLTWMVYILSTFCYQPWQNSNIAIVPHLRDTLC